MEMKIETEKEPATNILINNITTKGVVYSFIYLVITISIKYSDQYLNLLQTKDLNGNDTYIDISDTLFLGLQTPILMFIIYYFQSQSIIHDLPKKHALFVIIQQILSMIQQSVVFVGLWNDSNMII